MKKIQKQLAKEKARNEEKKKEMEEKKIKKEEKKGNDSQFPPRYKYMYFAAERERLIALGVLDPNSEVKTEPAEDSAAASTAPTDGSEDVKPKIKKEPESDDEDVDGVDMGKIIIDSVHFHDFDFQRTRKS